MSALEQLKTQGDVPAGAQIQPFFTPGDIVKYEKSDGVFDIVGIMAVDRGRQVYSTNHGKIPFNRLQGRFTKLAYDDSPSFAEAQAAVAAHVAAPAPAAAPVAANLSDTTLLPDGVVEGQAARRAELGMNRSDNSESKNEEIQALLPQQEQPRGTANAMYLASLEPPAAEAPAVAPVEVMETPEGCPANKAVGKHVGITEGKSRRKGAVIRAGTVLSFVQLPTEMQKDVEELNWIYGHCHIKIRWADTNTEQILDPSNVVPMSDDEFNAFVQQVPAPLPATSSAELVVPPQPVDTLDIVESPESSPIAAAPPIPPPRAQLAPQSKVRMVTPRVRVSPPGVPGRGSRAKTQRAARQEGIALGVAPPLPMPRRGTSTVASTIPAPPPLPGTGLATAFETRNSAGQPQPRPALPPEPPSFAEQAAAIKENGLALQEAQLQLARDQAATRAAKREVERQKNSRGQRFALRKGGRRKTSKKRKMRKPRKSTFRRHRKH
jgi:hypothetical protein